ncbi:Carboxylesterase [Limtongia smithiae]|uniref:Carboxylesterase n=1 Tax=Limtongia smithiae TaxID=1125753 RepID=UPI0034D00A72
MHLLLHPVLSPLCCCASLSDHTPVLTMLSCILSTVYYLWIATATVTSYTPYKCTCDGACTVTTSTGKYTGVSDSTGVRFLSLHYAKAPTGSLRFADPVAFSPQSDVTYSGTSLPPYCPQGTYDNESEDCLFLNVFRPTPVLNESLRPVMVWIHGGSFTSGGSADPVIYGADLAQNENIIVVTVNYRLGLLGMFDDGTNTNFAIKDVIMALQWVQTNIKLFRGDASKVTIAGQSSGGTLIRSLMSTSQASGLFERAILMSDPMDYGFYPRSTSTGLITPLVYSATGCSNITCMRGLSVDSLLTAQTTVASEAPAAYIQVNKAMPFSPVIDNSLIYSDFAVYAEQNTLPVKVPMLMGTTKDEANPAVESMFPSAISTVYYEYILQESIGQRRTETVMASGEFDLDDSNNDTTRLEGAFFSTSFYWTCAVSKLAEIITATSKTVYLYTLDVGITYPDYESFSLCQGAYVCHGSDLYPLFGTYNASTVTSAEIAVSQELQLRWGNYVKTGNPNTSGSSSSYASWQPVVSSTNLNAHNFGWDNVSQAILPTKCGALLGGSVPFDYQLSST